jgi:hypothetical protein
LGRNIASYEGMNSLLKSVTQGYHAKKTMPLGSYAVLALVFNGLLISVLRTRPADKSEAASDSPSQLWDFLILGAATHKLSRLITKDFVTSPFRAPFTHFQENAGSGETEEESRGDGMRRAVGDLLTCTYCAGPWVAMGLSYGMKKWPSESRRAMTLFSAVALSDFMHVIYEGTRAKKDRWVVEADQIEEKADKSSQAA